MTATRGVRDPENGEAEYDPRAGSAAAVPVDLLGGALDQGVWMRKLNAPVTGLNGAYLLSQNTIARRVGHVAHDALRLQATPSAETSRGILDSGHCAVGEPHPVAA